MGRWSLRSESVGQWVSESGTAVSQTGASAPGEMDSPYELLPTY
jgi:hypothetical protein